MTLYGVMMLSVGGVAFATAPWVGRTRAMAFGLIVLFASYLIYSYATLSPVIDALKPLSFFSWTAGHRPMAGVSDWPSVAALAAVDRRAVRHRRRRVRPARSRGRGQRRLAPTAVAPGRVSPVRSADSSPTGPGIALAWGLGIGLYGILIVASADAFSNMITNLPQIAALIEAVYPGLDLTQPSAVLQLTFFSFGSFIIGLAGATFLAGWASDEGQAPARSRPLDPAIARLRGRSAAGSGSWRAIGVVTLVIALLIGIAVVDPGRRRGRRRSPASASSGLAAAAFAGVGLAVGGLVRSSLAAGVTGVLIIATLLIDTLGAALKLPEWVLDLSIYKHLGQPMAGIFDPVGIVVATVMVVGGLALCAVGFTRRDIGR